VAGNNLTITDSQSGFGLRRKAIEAIQTAASGRAPFGDPDPDHDHRLKVAEVPIKVRYDIEGTRARNPVSHGVGC
jgi:hypothetical protein